MSKPEDALKYDAGKVPLELLPKQAMDEIAKVLGFGASKYGRDNWRKGMDWSRLIGAALRHITAFNDGEDIDPESGISHLAHAGCCISFLLAYQQLGLGRDDRYFAHLMEKADAAQGLHAQSGGSRVRSQLD
jgi:hypothetical protein